jgi:DNA-binding CsgD family transcriptional regulator/tetratricopeptide (TPR) repeat protein
MVRVTPYLLERQVELQALSAAVDRSSTGRGSAVLVLGEAGIGKTSLVHAFLAATAGRARVLVGTCEDLLTPRALGPLRDAARSAADGPLAAALSARANPDLVFVAVYDELASPPSPTLLVIEDAHWADGATLDVLRYLGPRVQNLPAVLLVTYRDDALARDHPLRGVLGVLGSTAATRLRLTRLSPDAVREMAAPTNVDPGELFQLSGGNPFFVTEVLANPCQMVPPTVVDAVLARVGTLSPPAQAALDRLAVIPSGTEVSLLRVLAGDLAPVAEAERAGVVEVRGDVVAFRHELARRAVAESLPASVRLELNADVLRALLTRPDSDPFRVLHHAVGAGDDDAVIRHGTAAAREATRVGAHAQAAACYAQVLARGHQLTTAQRAALGEAYAWALSNSNQLHFAAAAAATAAELWQQDGNDLRLVRALVTLARHQWLTERPVAARASAERALELARPLGDSHQHALGTLGLGGLLVIIDREEEGLPYLNEALDVAERAGAADWAALSLNYRGSALLQLGDLNGRDDLLRSMARATELGNHEYVMRAYYNLVEGLWRLGEYREALGYIEQAEHYARDQDFPVYGYMFAARRARLALMRGRWAEAEAELRALLDGQDDPGMIGRETVPILARVLVRQGSADAPAWLARAARHATAANVLEWLVPTGLAHIEHACLSGDHGQAGPYPELLLERTNRRGMLVQRGELLVYLHRLGYPARPFPGCPEPYASALRGDWRAAAELWLTEGDPYEHAVELAESGQVEPTLRAFTILDGLGARPAVAIVRGRLRGLGVTRLPRRPQPGTLANPAGLTDRQLEILRLVATGMSNAEIAQRLVVSPRTVDHHVSAVLQKLGVPTRRAAAALAAELASKPGPRGAT